MRSNTGRALATLRTIARLTIAETAALADVSPTYLQRIEVGHSEPTPMFVAEVTAAIAEHIKTTPSRPPLRRRTTTKDELRAIHD